MPKSRKRKRKNSSDYLAKERRTSSSSQSSAERLAGHRTIIRIAHKVASHQKTAAQAMANALGSELKPEHKLPKNEIWVRPKPQFLKLLLSVGAKGNTFTAKEVLSYLIKYISSRQLYDPLDPKKVFCKSDPLGQVFNVPSFTIKDAKRLLFENMVVCHKPPEMPPIPRIHSVPETRQDCYITFRNNQEHTRLLTQPSTFPVANSLPFNVPRPSATLSTDVNVAPRMSTGVDMADGLGKPRVDFKPLGMRSEVLPSGGTDEPDCGVPPPSPTRSQPHPLPGDSTQKMEDAGASAGGPVGRRRTKKHPKLRHKKRLGTASNSRKPRTRSESSGLTLTSHASQRSSLRSSNRSSNRLSNRSRSSNRSSIRSSTSKSILIGEAETKDDDLPWYCILYHPEEDIKSQSSEVWSVQGKETAVVTDTSDDLWFMEDERFSIEYEVASDSSDGVSSKTGESDSSLTDAEILLQVEDLSDSGDSRFADEDTTDSEIPEEDKWECGECGLVNNPVHGYCSRCWARRTGWLADEDRKNPSERLSEKQVLRRAFSAPAGCRESADQAGSTGQKPATTGHVNIGGSDEAGLGKWRVAASDGNYFSGNHGDETDSPVMSVQRWNSNGRKSMDFADGGGDSEQERKKENPVQHRYVLGQMSSLPLIPARIPVTASGKDNLITSQLSSVPEVPGVADTLSHHSSGYGCDDSAGGHDSAGSGSTQRKAMFVSREDSGVCMKKGTECKEGASHVKDTDIYDQHPIHINPAPVLIASAESKPEMQPAGLLTTPTSPTAAARVTLPMRVLAQTPPHASPGSSHSAGPSQLQELCRFCFARPKTASLIHGRTGHQVCCYRCAKKLRRRGKPCPVCRRPIQHIVKNYFS